MTILHSDFLAELAGFSRPEIHDFSLYTCCGFFDTIAGLLAKARIGRLSSLKVGKAALIDQLEMIYCLISRHNVQDWLTDRFVMTVDQAISEQIKLLKEVRTRHDLEVKAKTVGALQDVCSRVLNSIKREGWGHLQAFTREWLRKLKGGRERYSRVMVASCNVFA